MMRRIVALFVGCFLVLLLGIGFAKADVAVPPLRALATDLTGTLSGDELAALDQRLKAYEAEKGSQIAVLIVPTTQPETIEQYSLRVVEQWKIGRQKIDDGVLFLIAKNDRKMRIEVGYGLEGALPDITAKRIISDIVAPNFKSGDFVAGINLGVDAILASIGGEALPAPGMGRTRGHSSPVGGGIIVGVLGAYALLRLTRLSIRECILTVSVLTGMVAIFFTTMLYALLWICAAAFICMMFEFRIFSGFGGSLSGRGGGGWSGGGGRKFRWRRRFRRMVIKMLKRLFVHLFMSPLRLKSYVSASAMQAITAAVGAAEKGRDGQIRVAIEVALHPRHILKNMSSRERAVELFSQLRVWDTERNNGVLIYLCLADRQVEIVADRGFNHLVGPAEWELLCQKMEAEFRKGNFEAGILTGIQAVGQILELHLGPTAGANELPDSPAIL